MILSKQFKDAGLRVDVDDRKLRFNKKIQLAEKEWISYIITIGQKEVNSNTITLRIRNEDQLTTTVAKSITGLENKLKGYPQNTSIPSNPCIQTNKLIFFIDEK